jgi:hypothetical protein
MLVTQYDARDCGQPSSRTFLPRRQVVERGDGVLISAMPYLLDSTYAQVARRAEFRIDAILQAYDAAGLLHGISTTSPIEFDVVSEYDALLRDIRRRPVAAEALRRCG